MNSCKRLLILLVTPFLLLNTNDIQSVPIDRNTAVIFGLSVGSAGLIAGAVLAKKYYENKYEKLLKKANAKINVMIIEAKNTNEKTERDFKLKCVEFDTFKELMTIQCTGTTQACVEAHIELLTVKQQMAVEKAEKEAAVQLCAGLYIKLDAEKKRILAAETEFNNIAKQAEPGSILDRLKRVMSRKNTNNQFAASNTLPNTKLAIASMHYASQSAAVKCYEIRQRWYHQNKQSKALMGK